MNRTAAALAPVRLTPREAQVCKLLCQGLCDKDIAARLGIGVQNVKNRDREIFWKYGVRTRLELVVLIYGQR